MKIMTKSVLSLVLLAIAAPVLLFSGCGSGAAGGTAVADSQGCPSGSYLANATDVLTGPVDAAPFTVESFFNDPYLGGDSIKITPITFKVTEKDGTPRNNVCLTLVTGDTAAGPGPYWYTSNTYNTVLNGTGRYNYRTVATNDTGVAILYWSSAVLPPAITKTFATAGPPPTYTAGADQKGTSFIHVNSGTKSASYNFEWTVKGEPAT